MDTIAKNTLAKEYTRDLAKGIQPAVPVRYFPNDHPAGVPLFQWKAHADLLFANWLNYEVYQITPYRLSNVEKQKAASGAEVSDLSRGAPVGIEMAAKAGSV